MGPVERELRESVRDNGKFLYPCTNEAWRVLESAHESLIWRHCGSMRGGYPGCCAEAMSEAIEAAEALGL